MSAPGYDPAMRFRVNLSFDGYRHGEIVHGDPVLCARYVTLGWLTELGVDGGPLYRLPGNVDFLFPPKPGGTAITLGPEEAIWAPDDEDDDAHA